MLKTLTTTLTATVLSLGVANASPTLDISTFNSTIFADTVSQLENTIVENFETFDSGEFFTLLTSVGTIEVLGGRGTGQTVQGTPGNSGEGMFVRDNAVQGRVNTTPGGDTFLDSNDTFGFQWNIVSQNEFDTVLFTVTDASDNGADLFFELDDVQLGSISRGERNGNIKTVMLSFETAVTDAVLTMRSSKLNDGFSIDDLTLGATPAPVPLPAGIILLATALGLVRFVKKIK